MKYNYKTKGTCSRQINIEVDNDGKIENIEFVGGCNGNTKGIAALVKGMNKEDVISRLRGIKCGPRSTSCPDQLAIALESIEKQGD